MYDKLKKSNTFIDPRFIFITIDVNHFLTMGDIHNRWQISQYLIFILSYFIENNKTNIYVTIIGVMGKMTTKEIRDPVYRFVHVNPYELNIIESPYFQRLRYIHHLGLTYYVYPGATHKRFEHSLGTMEIATKLFDILKEKNRDIFIKNKKTGEGLFEDDDEIKRYRQILRVACLLHDIGHYPFSHSAEDIWEKGHEEMGKDIILGKDMRKRIEKCPPGMNIKAEELSFIISNEPETSDGRLHFLQEILTGDLGVDRIDYLVRDSLHTGVLYGRFDYYRLLDTFIVYIEKEENPMLCLEKGGIHAAEGLILARYFMFSQVYYHKTRSAYDLHLKEYMKEFKNFSENKKIDYTDVSNFLGLNDFTVLNQMAEDSKLNKGEKRGDLATLILERKHHRRVDEINSEDLVISENPERIFDKIEDKISKKYKKEVKNGDILFDRSMKKTNRFEEADFYICDEGELSHILKESKLIERLKKIDLFRIYVAKGKLGMGKDIKKLRGEITKKYMRGR